MTTMPILAHARLRYFQFGVHIAVGEQQFCSREEPPQTGRLTGRLQFRRTSSDRTIDRKATISDAGVVVLAAPRRGSAAHSRPTPALNSSPRDGRTRMLIQLMSADMTTHHCYVYELYLNYYKK